MTARVRAAVALLLMVLAVAAAHIWRPTAHLADTRPKVELEALFPKSFGDWVIDERVPLQLVSPDTQAFLNAIYNQTLSRIYVNRAGQRVMLAVAYGGDQSDATRAHRPEVCYPAQGFQITFNQTGQLQLVDRTVPLRQLVARSGGRNEPISYWVTVGERVSTSGMEQKLAQLSYSMRGFIPDGMLVRVSMVDADVANGFSIQSQFLAQMFEAMPEVGRTLVFGKAAT